MLCEKANPKRLHAVSRHLYNILKENYGGGEEVSGFQELWTRRGEDDVPRREAQRTCEED